MFARICVDLPKALTALSIYTYTSEPAFSQTVLHSIPLLDNLWNNLTLWKWYCWNKNMFKDFNFNCLIIFTTSKCAENFSLWKNWSFYNFYGKLYTIEIQKQAILLVENYLQLWIWGTNIFFLGDWISIFDFLKSLNLTELFYNSVMSYFRK